jgi:hypothetical protein
MSDDPKKRGGPDRRLVAGGQAHEVDYLARKLQPEFPGKSRAEIEAAIKSVTKIPEFQNRRPMIENAAKAKLGKYPWSS